MQTQPHPSFVKVLVGALLALALAAPTAVAAPTPEPPAFPKAVPSQPGELTGTPASTKAAHAQQRYYASYGDTGPLSPPSTATADSGGVDWAAIGIGIGGTAVLLGAMIALIMRARRRTHSVRLAA